MTQVTASLVPLLSVEFSLEFIFELYMSLFLR